MNPRVNDGLNFVCLSAAGETVSEASGPAFVSDPAPVKMRAWTRYVMGPVNPKGGTSTQRNFWKGASSDGVHFRVSAVVSSETPTSKLIRFDRTFSAWP